MQQREVNAVSRAVLGPVCVAVALIAFTFAFVANAATPSAQTQAEITHLLDYLGGSQCDFYRNGSWHDAPAARAHLEKKRDYLLKRSLIGSTEDFITRAATGSSLTGEKYQVRCKPNPAVPSSEWLRAELKRYRAEGPKRGQ